MIDCACVWLCRSLLLVSNLSLPQQYLHLWIIFVSTKVSSDSLKWSLTCFYSEQYLLSSLFKNIGFPTILVFEMMAWSVQGCFPIAFWVSSKQSSTGSRSLEVNFILVREFLGLVNQSNGKSSDNPWPKEQHVHFYSFPALILPNLRELEWFPSNCNFLGWIDR